jgi:hypothetical protein
MIDEELVRLIRATIQDELRTARMKVPEFAGAGGNTVISSRGDIILTPGVGRHAYYQKDSGRIEIGSGTGGGGGAVTSVFGRTGAVTAVNTDYSAYYLLLTGGTMAGAIAMGTYGITGTGDVLPHDSGGHYCGDDTHHWLSLYSRTINIPYGAGVSTSIYTNISGVMILYAGGENLKISSTAITAMVTLAMSGTKITGLAAGSVAGDAIRYEQLVGQGYIQTSGTCSANYISKFSDGTHITNSNIQDSGTVITAGVTLAMGTNNITGTGDVLPHDSGGHYCGDSTHHFLSLYSRTINIPYSASVNSYLVTNISGSLEVYTPTSILLKTNVTPVTRLTIADAGITAAVTLAMSGTKITGLAAGTTNGDALRYEQLIGAGYIDTSGTCSANYISKFSDGTSITNSSIQDSGSVITMGNHIHMGDLALDFRTDDIHKILYYNAASENELRISSYHQISFYTTVDTTVQMLINDDGVRLATPLFFRKNHADDFAYIVDSATGDMEFHVKTGDKFKFVVDA